MNIYDTGKYKNAIRCNIFFLFLTVLLLSACQTSMAVTPDLRESLTQDENLSDDSVSGSDGSNLLFPDSYPEPVTEETSQSSSPAETSEDELTPAAVPTVLPETSSPMATATTGMDAPSVPVPTPTPLATTTQTTLPVATTSTATAPQSVTTLPSTAPSTSRSPGPGSSAPTSKPTPPASPTPVPTARPTAVPTPTPLPATTASTVGTTAVPSTTAATTVPPTTSALNSVAQYKADILRYTNEERSKFGLPPLQAANSQLAAAAQNRADEIVILFDHTRPDGREPFSVLSDYSITFTYAAENIAYNTASFYSAYDTVQMWMNSSGHRQNILDQNQKILGVGYAISGTRAYVTQLFIG